MTSFFPPFDPNERRGNRRRLPRIPIQYVIPNLVTLLALCAGLTSIRMAIEGRYALAIGAIVLAALLDGLDGRVARMLKSTSRFGAELDSLTDFVNFGVGPAILLYTWILNEVKSVGWIAAMIFAICTALRLARFNVALDAPDKPDWQGNFFVGVPAPAGALTVLLPVYLEQVGVPHWSPAAPLVLVYTLFVGLLMVSRFPTWSGKKIGRRVPRDMVMPLFVLVVVAVAFLASYPFHVLTAISVGYLCLMPFSWISWHRKKAAEAAGTLVADEDDEDEDEDAGEEEGDEALDAASGHDEPDDSGPFDGDTRPSRKPKPARKPRSGKASAQIVRIPRRKKD